MDATTRAEAEIREIVDRETRAWDTQDLDLLNVVEPDRSLNGRVELLELFIR